MRKGAAKERWRRDGRMKFRFEKNMRILYDLISYCHGLGARDVDIKLHGDDQQFRLILDCEIPNLNPEELEILNTELNRPRQHEIENNYWGLSSVTDYDSELTLIGMMIDECDIQYQDEKLHIEVVRYQN